jgi:hypothetical protein
VPTLRAWLLLAALFVGAAVTLLLGGYRFFAVTAPHPDGPVVIEGWAGQDCIAVAIAEYRRHDYPLLLFTGGPIEPGSLFGAYPNFAELGVANAELLGFPRSSTQAVHAPPVTRDRTYASALALRQWFEARGPLPPHLTLVSSGVHTRRSRDLFQHAFGKQTAVGSIAVRDSGFDPSSWWTSSTGFRSVIAELISYTYVTLFFWRDEP